MTTPISFRCPVHDCEGDSVFTGVEFITTGTEATDTESDADLYVDVYVCPKGHRIWIYEAEAEEDGE